MKIYVNGVLDKSLANTNGLVYNTNANVYLGGTNLSPNYPFSGTIDNARFYNRKLSDSEMYALYSQDPACSVSGFPPVSSFSANPSSLCAGNSIALTDLSSNTPTSWNWQITGAASMSSSVNNPTLTLSNPGNYIISLVSTNANGAGNTFTQSITVKPNPTITVSASNVACLGQTVTLTASGASTYSWNSGPTGATIAVSPAQNTTYSVIGTSTNGCLGFAPKTITVFAPPVLAISGNSIICEGASTSLLVSGSALTYTWTNNFTGNLVSVSPAVSTSYSVSGTDVNGCIGVASQVVVVNSSPIVMANATSTAICVGDAALLNGSGASTYAWSGGVQNNIPFFPNTTAIYSVTGTGTNGCKKTATMQVHVNSLPVLSLTSNSSMAICPGEPVILSATGANLYSWSSGQVLPVITINPTVTTQFTVTGTDANGCKSSLMYTQNVYACLGLESGSPDGGVFIYPNPAFEEIHVVIPGGAGPLRLELYTASGSKLREYAVTAPQSIVKLSEYSPGVYTIRLYRGNALIGLKKLVKSQH